MMYDQQPLLSVVASVGLAPRSQLPDTVLTLSRQSPTAVLLYTTNILRYKQYCDFNTTIQVILFSGKLVSQITEFSDSDV